MAIKHEHKPDIWGAVKFGIFQSAQLGQQMAVRMRWSLARCERSAATHAVDQKQSGGWGEKSLAQSTSQKHSFSNAGTLLGHVVPHRNYRKASWPLSNSLIVLCLASRVIVLKANQGIISSLSSLHAQNKAWQGRCCHYSLGPSHCARCIDILQWRFDRMHAGSVPTTLLVLLSVPLRILNLCPEGSFSPCLRLALLQQNTWHRVIHKEKSSQFWKSRSMVPTSWLWLYHNMVDSTVVGANVRERDHMAKQ
jgi:hypothetical protein